MLSQTYSDGKPGHRSLTSTRWKRSERGLLPCASRGEFVSALSQSQEPYTLTDIIAPPTPPPVGTLIRQNLMSLAAVVQDHVRVVQRPASSLTCLRSLTGLTSEFALGGADIFSPASIADSVETPETVSTARSHLIFVDCSLTPFEVQIIRSVLPLGPSHGAAGLQDSLQAVRPSFQPCRLGMDYLSAGRCPITCLDAQPRPGGTRRSV